jgi:hypothetical protein
MSQVDPCPALLAELTARGLNGDTKEAQTIVAWLRPEIGTPDGPAVPLAEAVSCAVDLVQVFLEKFAACYLTEDCCGERWVRCALRNRFGFAPEPAVEAVLERIRGRCFHLLESFRRRYQPVLFGPRTFRPEGVPGFLQQVAWVESRKAPLNKLRLVASTPADVLDGSGWPARDSDGSDFAGLARLVAAFWNQDCFTPAMRLEGLISLGLGDLTRDEELAQRCRQHLAGRLPAWEARGEQLMERLHRLLDRQGAAEARLLLPGDSEQRRQREGELAALRSRLAGLRLQVQAHQLRLLPRPCEVQELLQGRVQNYANVRFRRIGQEVELFGQRVAAGADSLPRGGPGALLGDLLPAVRRHQGSQPASPRQRHLEADERQRRQQHWRLWLEEGMRLCERLHAVLGRVAPPGPVEQAVAWWVSDVLDLYELGLLDRVGVIGGLRRPHWRLQRLLRQGV